jgi:surface antigen
MLLRLHAGGGMDGCEAKRWGLHGDDRVVGRDAGPSGRDEIMRNIKGRCAVLCLCLACTAPVAAQSAADSVANAAPPCQTIAGQAEIDGTMQQITGLACQQPDGTWQIVQGDDNTVAVYPAPVYPYYDPWYWGGVVSVGFGGPFIFVDRFHHRYPMGHVHFSRVSYGAAVRSGGWHGSGTWHSAGGMHGGWGGGGGMHR